MKWSCSESYNSYNFSRKNYSPHNGTNLYSNIMEETIMVTIIDSVTGMVLCVEAGNQKTDLRGYGPVHEYGSDYEERR